MDNAKKLAREAAAAIADKKGRDILILELEGVSLIADYFVIATGSSTTQLQSLANNVEEKLEDLGVKRLRREGFNDATWILLDYGSVVVHFFQEEQRQFYNLERLWGDARKLEWVPELDG